jgi:hypothetical protein
MTGIAHAPENYMYNLAQIIKFLENEISAFQKLAEKNKHDVDVERHVVSFRMTKLRAGVAEDVLTQIKTIKTAEELASFFDDLDFNHPQTMAGLSKVMTEQDMARFRVLSHIQQMFQD